MRALALTIALTGSGCALLASANANHNSHGTACIESPAFATVDLVIGLLLVGAAATSDASAAVYVIPGAFVASGVIGGLSAIRCSRKHAKTSNDTSPPLTNSAPSFGNAPVDPAAVPATSEDLGVAPVQVVAPNPPPPLRLDPDSQIARPKPAPGEEPKPKISCRDAPGSCPKGQACAIAGDDAGYCEPERPR